MSQFSDMFVPARERLLGVHGQTSVSFTPAGSPDAETVTAIVAGEDNELVQDPDGLVKERRRVIAVPMAGDERTVERARGGVFLLDQESWTIRIEIGADGETGMARLDCRCPVKLDGVGSTNRSQRIGGQGGR